MFIFTIYNDFTPISGPPKVKNTPQSLLAQSQLWLLPLECVPQPSIDPLATKQRPALILTMYGRYTVPTDVYIVRAGVSYRCGEFSSVMVIMDAVCLALSEKSQLAMTAVKCFCWRGVREEE